MIKTMEQAVQVQTRRYCSNKLGISKAVRRFLKPGLDEGHSACYELRDSLPVNWPKPEDVS